MGDTWDLVVVGGGPGGAAAAHVVARGGWRVLMLDRRTARVDKFGEALPPAAVDLVSRLLGSLTAPTMTRGGLEMTRGNLACWADEAPEFTDFFHSPAGHGLAMDRSRFDPALARCAMESGALVRMGCSVRRCRRSEGEGFRWRLQLGDGSEIQTRYVIDASGRAATIGRELKVRRRRMDQLFAFRRYFVSDRPDDDAYTRIEAAEHGWWYSHRIPSGDPNGLRVVDFHTDRDLPVARLAAQPAGFMDLLAKTSRTSVVLEEAGYRAVGKVRGACAASSALAQFAGDGWLAVGDAAQALDPLSSQGVTKALEQGFEAGHRVHHALTDCARMRPLFKTYAMRRARQWQSYRAQHRMFYLSQPRWPTSPFWNRRRHADRSDNVRSGGRS